MTITYSNKKYVEHWKSDFGVDHLVMSMCRVFSCVVGKGRETRDQIANNHRIIKKAREFQKNIYFCFIDYAKGFDCVDHNKLENS